VPVECVKNGWTSFFVESLPANFIWKENYHIYSLVYINSELLSLLHFGPSVPAFPAGYFKISGPILKGLI
jgi:hypothetical protein